MNFVEAFVLLQALDFVTTLIGLHLGAGEGSLFISWLMSATNPVAALTIAKSVGFAWGGYCLLRRKPVAIKMANYLFAGVVLSNLWQIGSLLAHGA
ncbi:MAG: hypothetical protein M1541_20095 [Acidobacteria bacterium]|nr:hypothetical protein [Acidobacteriota bacterium]